MTLEDKVKAAVRNIPDFPKKGINFKDITPVLADPKLVSELLDYWTEEYKDKGISKIIGIESRGFLFGTALAERLKVPFIPVRKKGKLPADIVSYSYDLEYGSETIEIHSDALNKNDNILIHDDLLATGGTADAAVQLCKQQNVEIYGCCFLIELNFLKGREKIGLNNERINSIVQYH